MRRRGAWALEVLARVVALVVAAALMVPGAALAQPRAKAAPAAKAAPPAKGAPGKAGPPAKKGCAPNDPLCNADAKQKEKEAEDAPGTPVATPPPPPAQEAPPEVVLPPTEAELARGMNILKVTLAGNRRVASEDIANYLTQMRPGKPFTSEGLARDVREMWDSGYFEDISVDLTRRDDGVILRILVRERPNVKTLEFTGNEKLDKDELTEALSAELKTGTILSYAAIRRGIQKLRDKYAEEGYFLAEVTYEVLPLKENQVSIKFTIREHDPVGVRRITFIGNHHVPDAELREVMITGASSFLDFGTGSTFRQDAFERDVAILNALYYDRGFLSVQVATPRVMLTPDRSGIEITLSITEGPRYKIRQLRIFEKSDENQKEIEPLGGRRHLREMIRAKSGDYFNRAELVKDLGAVQTMYRDAGYANVEATPQTELDPEREEVDIVVPIKRRQLVYFGRIEIKGNTKTRDKVIRREMEIEESALFSESKLERSKRRITALGYFERVDISTEQGDDATHLNVNVEIGEKPTGTFQVGAGFSSLENFIATAQVQQANLFGNGQSLALQAQISGLRQLIDVRFFEPYFLDTKFNVSANVFDRLQYYNEFSQNSAGGSLSVGYPIINPELSVAMTYTLQNDKVSTSGGSTFLGTASAVSIFQRLPLANLFNDGITSSIRPTITYDTRDNRLFAASGIFLQGSVEFASKYLGSHNQFIRYRATGRFYYPVNASKSVVVKLNTEAGMVTSPGASGVPIFARFFLGGILDLRGFPIRSVGPRLPLKTALDPNSSPYANGATIGGNLMYYQNLELEFPIIDAVQIRGVVFTDLGNTWNLESLYCHAAPASPFPVTNPCFGPGSIFNVRTSWGFGIRWFSPLGPLRFEWGFPFKPLPYENASDFQFTIGNFF